MVKVKRYMSGSERLKWLGSGIALLIAAALIGGNADFDGSGLLTIVVAVFGIGGIIGAITGFEQM